LDTIKKTLPILFIIISFSACNNNANNSSNSINFALNSLKDGTVHRLEEYKGEPLVLNFWASWCAPCREEMPLLQQVWAEHNDEGIKFVGINIMDDKKDAMALLEKTGVSYTNLYDKDGKVSNAFGVSALPVTVFMDSAGKIIKKKFGPYLGKNGEKLFESDLGELTE